MATMTRINITFDPETLRLADREAKRRKSTRSGVVRSAIRALASEAEREQADRQRQERQRRAVADMDRMARKAGNWPAVEILRASRYGTENGRK